MRLLFRLVLASLVALMALQASSASGGEPLTVGQVRLELLRQLERDGYLSPNVADEVRQKYVDPRELRAPFAESAAVAAPKESLWDRYLSWTNVFKVVGVILVLVAFQEAIVKGVGWTVALLRRLPREAYQASVLGVTATATVWPERLWTSQAFYVALFGAYANISVLRWILRTHPQLEQWLAKRFGSRLPQAVSLVGLFYFSALALGYQSRIFGFLAAVCFSGFFSFGLMYRPGLLTMHFRQSEAAAVVFGHLVVLCAYALVKINGYLQAQTALFAAGIEYYCTIAMGVAFLVGASPWYSKHGRFRYLALFVIVLFAALMGYFFFDLKVIGSILCCVAVLLALEWLGALSYRGGFMAGTLALGSALYASALLLERYAYLIVLRLA